MEKKKMSFHYSDINKKSVLDKYEETYNFIKNFSHIDGFDEAVEWFDTQMQTCAKFKDFVHKLTKIRKAFFTEEKEIVSLVFALDSMGIKAEIDNEGIMEQNENEAQENVEMLSAIMGILQDEFRTYNNDGLFTESNHTEGTAIVEDDYIVMSAVLDFDIPMEKGYAFVNQEIQEKYNKFYADKGLNNIDLEDYADFIEECNPVIFTIALNMTDTTMTGCVDLGNNLGSVIVDSLKLPDEVEESTLRKAVQQMVAHF